MEKRMYETPTRVPQYWHFLLCPGFQMDPHQPQPNQQHSTIQRRIQMGAKRRVLQKKS